jgi:lipopolysaccharide transport system ATP-binding protein
MPIIEVDHITKEYRLGAMQGLKQTLLHTAAKLTGKTVAERPLFKALNDVNFSIKAGEVVGIIGHNGAGKSTLLKMLAGISKPTRGQIKVIGRIAPLIEVGAGFVPDFTGRENVYLNGSILGLTRKEIDQKFDEIVDFAEMSEFIDTPVKRYSSGMQVKLAFAVATSIESEILIVDEVLAVGDLAFQRKCFDRMEDLIKREGRTVLLVSHNIRQVQRLCSRVILLDHGRIIADGDPIDVCNQFYEQSDRKIIEQAKNDMPIRKPTSTKSSGEIDFEGIAFRDATGSLTNQAIHGEDYIIEIHFKAHSDLVNVIFGIGIHTTDFVYLADRDTEDDDQIVPYIPAGPLTVICRISDFPLLPGVYSFRIGVAVGPVYRIAFYAENVASFQVQGKHKSRTQSFIPIKTQWDIQYMNTSAQSSAPPE